MKTVGESIAAQAVGYKISGQRIKEGLGSVPAGNDLYLKRVAEDGTLIFTADPNQALKYLLDDAAVLKSIQAYAKANQLELAWFGIQEISQVTTSATRALENGLELELELELTATASTQTQAQAALDQMKNFTLTGQPVKKSK